MPNISRTDVAATAAAATVTSLSSRRMRGYRVLTGVAAAAIVGVVAVAALNSTNSDDDNGSSAIEASAGTEALPDLKVAAHGGRSSCRHGGRRRFGGRIGRDRQRSRARRSRLPEIETADALREYAATVENRTLAAPAAQSDATVAPQTQQRTKPRPRIHRVSHPTRSSSARSCSKDQLAFAVREASTGTLRAIDASDCHVLIEVETP